MTVHHAGTLTEAYFESYLTLIMNARNYDPKQAKAFMEKEFFKGNILEFGDHTAENFQAAYKTMCAKANDEINH